MAESRHIRRSLMVGFVAAAVAGVVGLGGPVAAAPAPEGTIMSVGGADVVPDSYIVVFKDGTDRVPDRAREVAQRHGAAVQRTYSAALRGFAGTMTERQARRIAADPRVDYVQPNAIMRTTATQNNPPWGLDRIDQRNRPLNNTYVYNTTASNVRVYILDTGIRLSHSDFGGRAVTGFDAVTAGGTANDCHGHGTHVAGTAGGNTYGVAKGVTLVAVRVLNCSGSGTTDQIVAGIDWVTRNAVRPAVANMSLGGGANTAIDNAVRASIASGVTYAIAAGNGFFGLFAENACSKSPARVTEAITVSITDNADRKPSWGNVGTCVDVFAPGASIPSAWHTNDTATNSISGTSMSAPHVAGAAALYLAGNPGATPAQVHAAIVNNATTGVVQSPGSGTPNRLLYTGNF